MQDDIPSAEVAWFLREAANAFPAEPPAPGPELALLLAEGLPGPALTAPSPLPTRRSTVRSAMSNLPRKIALAAAGLTFAGTGIAAASTLPGVDLPGPEITEALPEVTTTLPADITTTLPDVTTTLPEVTTTVPEVTTTVPDVATTLPDVTTPTTGGAGVLPPAATTASEAAKIHAFDEACGNHGQYVSYVARFGTEPPCATGVRTGTTTPTVPTGGATDEPAGRSKGGAKPAKAGSQGAGAGRGGR